MAKMFELKNEETNMFFGEPETNLFDNFSKEIGWWNDLLDLIVFILLPNSIIKHLIQKNPLKLLIKAQGKSWMISKK